MPRPENPQSLARGTGRRLLDTPRGAFLFTLTIFATTLVQVLAVPVAALVDGTGQWPLAVPEPVGFTLLILGCAAQASALLLIDRAPGLAVIGTAGTYVLLAVGLATPTWVTPMQVVIGISLFLLATGFSVARSILWCAGVALSCIAALLIWVLSIGTGLNVAIGFVAAQGVGIVAAAAGGTALGSWWGAQTRRLRLARHRAELAKQEHEQRVEQARERERARIAQELHDVAGQHLAGLITLADAGLKLAPEEPNEALHLLEDVRNEGRFAAASLAGALSDFRAAGSRPTEVTRDLRQAEQLIAYWRQRGMRLDFDATGDLGGLPAVVSATAYRSLQEALTNAAKHAPGSEVEVEITYANDVLNLAVTNTPPPGDAAPLPGLNLGWGLSGMREHIDLLRGTLAAGTTIDGGWVLRVRVPVARVS